MAAAEKILRFTCTKVNAGKAVAKPDKDGYYCDLIFGAFDIVTPQRWAFPFAGVEDLLKPGSPLHRRAKGGALKGEWGHPRKQPGETDEEFAQRIMTVDERNTAIHIRDFRLVPATTPEGHKYVQVRGDVKPSGPYGKHFEEAMQNPHENMGLSIRGFSRDVWRGITKYSTFTRIFTWDAVHEQGIPEANKMDSLLDATPNMQSLTEVEIPVSALMRDGTPTEAGLTMLSAGIDIHDVIANCSDGGATRDSRAW